MKDFFLILITAAFIYNTAAQTLPPMNKQPNKEMGDDAAARSLIAVQPDFTAEASCLNYENTAGGGFGELVKMAKKADWYRHESKTFIDYFVPDESAVRYTFKNKKYETFAGDAENHLWFMNAESPVLLGLDKNLKFEIVERETVDFEMAGKTGKRELIKIKVTGETTVGGDWDKTVVFLYVAPDLKNLVVKTELIFPKGGRNCTLRNISFDVADRLFTDYVNYRRLRADKFLTVPKVEDIREIKTSPSSGRKWFTPESLLEALPKFVTGGNYKPKMIWQYGSIELKNGTVINWRAGSEKMLVLYNRGGETYFQLPAKANK